MLNPTRQEDLEKITRTAGAFKILSDPTRFKIFCLLLNARDGLCVHEISEQIDISHSAASHQLAKLEAKGVVECFREGQSACYKLQNSPFTKSLISITRIFEHVA